MKAGSWPSIGLIYLYGVLSSASLSKIIPLQADFIAHAGASAAGFALFMALVTIPAALLAAVVGSLIDRVGARTALIAAATAGALANALYVMAGSLIEFQAIRVFEGLVMVGAYSAAPALIMATASSERRGRAMALWSTYTPVGISLGLVLSASFAGTDAWRGGYWIHGALFGVLAVAGFSLPKPVRRGQASTQPRPGLLAAYAQPGPLRLALTFATLVLTGFGANAVVPAWLAAQHGIAIGVASNILALANLSMIAGGVVVGILLARGVRDYPLFLVLVASAVAISAALFAPGLQWSARMAALVAWLIVSGASVAVVTATLPRVVRDASQGASAAGLLSQLAALTTFATPQIWLPILASGKWPLFIVIVLMAGSAGALLFPRAAKRE